MSLHICQIGKYYPPHRGGMESHLEALCRLLQTRFRLTVVVANDHPLSKCDHSLGWRLVRAGRWGELFSVPMAPMLIVFSIRSRADVVHLHVPNPLGAVAALLCSFRGAIVVTYHSDVLRQRWLGYLLTPLMDLVARRAESIICTSPNYIDSSVFLAKHSGKCTVVPFGVEPRFFGAPNEVEVSRIRQRFGGKFILSIGRLVYYKGFDVLIRAMVGVDVHCVIVGTGPLKEQLIGLAAECGVSERVSIVSGVDDVLPYLHASECFVLPSVARTEAFGIVQLEAMASGRPVVNTALLSGVPFVSVHEQTGLTVPPGDVDALRNALRRLLASPEDRIAFGLAARERARSVFSEQQMCDQIAATYEKAASAWAQRRRR